LATHGQAQEQQTQTCSHPAGWKPTDDELKQILAEHRRWTEDWRKASFRAEWASQHPQGRANLCNANLGGAELNKANLGGVELNKANLGGAKLNEADLDGAKLNEAGLLGAELNEANLAAAELNKADLRWAKLNEANLFRAELNKADLGSAKLKDATLSYANLTGAIYAPASPPPTTYVAGIMGLETVTFPPGEEIGLVQLRKLLQDGGLRDLERQATYAIEHGKTLHAIENWKEEPARAGEGVFRLVAFELTTAYGLRPGRTLLLLVASIGVFSVIYAVALTSDGGGIYRVRPQGRMEREFGVAKLVGQAEVEPLLPWGFWAALGPALQFSLLSAFHIGFREFSVGAWLARLQGSQYTLEALGWVRRVSGLQSLLSVYLLAMWALTYFGRPFQ
jgi:hypothetical protein